MFDLEFKQMNEMEICFFLLPEIVKNLKYNLIYLFIFAVLILWFQILKSLLMSYLGFKLYQFLLPAFSIEKTNLTFRRAVGSIFFV